MKIKHREVLLIIIQFILFIANILLTLLQDNASFRFWSICGTINAVILAVILCYWQRKVVTGINMFFASFCLFQYGLPMLSTIDTNYSNWYLELFGDTIKGAAANYSTLAINVASIALCIGQLNKSNKFVINGKKWGDYFVRHKQLVARAAFVLFIVTAIVVIPMTGLAMFHQLSSGLYSTANRDVMTENAILRFAQEFFYSSAFLYLCFSNNKKRKKVIKIIFAIACINMVLLADRAIGLVGILLLFYYNSYFETKGGSISKQKRKSLKFIVLGIGVAILMVIIANARLGKNVGIVGIFAILGKSIFEEFGFSFTSICFVMDYIPGVDSFKYGATYLASVIKLIPSSMDVFNILSSPSLLLGETWLYNMNNTHGRSFLDFGVGFSLIAESYMNFAWLGLLLIYIAVFMVSKLLQSKNDSEWGQYVQLIMLFNLLLLPRRQFATLLKAFEYSILFMSLYLIVFISLSKGRRNCNKEQD